MAIDALLARLEGRAVTPVSDDVTPAVTRKPLLIKPRTAVTSVTAEDAEIAVAVRDRNQLTAAAPNPIHKHTAERLPPSSDELRAATRDQEAEFVEAFVLPDPDAEARRLRLVGMLEAHPTAKYALLTDTEADPEAVIVALAIRGRATCEIRIPRDKYDGTLLLDLIEQHGGTVQ